MKKFALMAGVSALALAVGAEMAAAQELDVRSHSRPEYDPIGMRAGSFLIFPNAELGETYNDNIYAQQNNPVDDWITTLRPEIDVRSDWNNHSLNLGAYGEAGLYADNSDEDYLDYGIGGDGILDVSRATNIFAGASFNHLHDERGSPDAVNGTEPTQFDRYRTNLGATFKPNRFGVTAEGDWMRSDYDNVGAVGGGTINNDDRDRDEYNERLRVSYDVQPGYTAFVQGALNQRDYDISPDDNGFNRNSDGWRADVGMAIALTKLIDGEVYAGYFEQDYDDPRFGNVGEWDIGVDLTWAVTPLTSVRAGLMRDVGETTSANASSYVATVATLAVDHELRRNIIVGGNVGYTNNNYQDISRDDDIWTIGVNGKYLINRNFYAGGEVSYVDRDSGSGAFRSLSYDQFKAGVMVGVQF